MANVVHEDENWRQRLRAEQSAATQWRDSWGFLEYAKPAGAVHVDRQIPNRHLTRTMAEQGALYPFLQQTYRDTRDGRGQTHSTVGGTAVTHTGNSPASTTKVWRGDPDAPRWNPNVPFPPTAAATASRNAGHTIVNGTTRQPISPTNSQKRAQATLSSSKSSSSSAALPIVSLEARPATPVLRLDSTLAKTLMPKYEQDIGGCVWTNGVDPHVKYRHPITSSHVVGWENKSLEFFGIGQHGTRDNKKLYGWE